MPPVGRLSVRTVRETPAPPSRLRATDYFPRHGFAVASSHSLCSLVENGATATADGSGGRNRTAPASRAVNRNNPVAGFVGCRRAGPRPVPDRPLRTTSVVGDAHGLAGGGTSDCRGHEAGPATRGRPGMDTPSCDAGSSWPESHCHHVHPGRSPGLPGKSRLCSPRGHRPRPNGLSSRVVRPFQHDRG